ncbi:MAG: hypothetical protein V4617_10500, partial [Gemmatimonadota bacterium]
MLIGVTRIRRTRNDACKRVGDSNASVSCCARIIVMRVVRVVHSRTGHARLAPVKSMYVPTCVDDTMCRTSHDVHEASSIGTIEASVPYKTFTFPDHSLRNRGDPNRQRICERDCPAHRHIDSPMIDRPGAVSSSTALGLEAALCFVRHQRIMNGEQAGRHAIEPSLRTFVSAAFANCDHACADCGAHLALHAISLGIRYFSGVCFGAGETCDVSSLDAKGHSQGVAFCVPSDCHSRGGDRTLDLTIMSRAL